MSCGDNCSCKGTKDVHNTDDYKRGYREGYKDGMEIARKLLDPFIPVSPVLPNDGFTQDMRGCNICGIDFSKGVWGYVCNHPQCPSRITC